MREDGMAEDLIVGPAIAYQRWLLTEASTLVDELGLYIFLEVFE